MTRGRVLDASGFLLAAATGLVCAGELAILVRCLTVLSPPDTAAVMASFHAGYLVADQVRSRLRMPSLLVTLSVCCALLAAALVHLSSGFAATTALGAAGVAFNTASQAVRRGLKRRAIVPIPVKNASKTVGMVFGGATGASAWMSPAWLVSVIPLCLFAAWVTSRRRADLVQLDPEAAHQKPRRGTVLLVAELLHHAHYFAYVYTFWYIAPSLIGPLSGVWFLLGWLAYFVAEVVWRERRRAFSPTVMAAGHLVVAVMVLLMPHVTTSLVLIVWFVTGIGGGTAYMLGNVEPQGNRELYEDIGHVGGVSVAAIVGGVAGGSAAHSSSATLIAAASLACAAAVTFWLARGPRTSPRSERSPDPKCA